MRNKRSNVEDAELRIRHLQEKRADAYKRWYVGELDKPEAEKLVHIYTERIERIAKNGGLTNECKTLNYPKAS